MTLSWSQAVQFNCAASTHAQRSRWQKQAPGFLFAGTKNVHMPDDYFGTVLVCDTWHDIQVFFYPLNWPL